MKVYIVTVGTYSDYHIERVFSTKKKAQEYLDYLGNTNDANMEEYVLDEETPRGVFEYHVSIDEKDGRAKAELMDFDYSLGYYRKDAFQYKNILGRKYYWFNIEAKNAPHAIKIASERLMQIKAMPYLFPKIKENCVCNEFSFSYNNKMHTPIYDYNTREIIIDKNEWVEE